MQRAPAGYRMRVAIYRRAWDCRKPHARPKHFHESAGWDEQGQLALGIHLPNVLPLEGILSLTTGKAKLEYCKDSGFSLYLSDISLKALGALKLPPNGQISVTIHEGGWFAAYIKQT